MSSDQIAYLRDLANSYFQEGNLAAAISTWEQVLSMDPTNVEARQGLTLAQMKQAGVNTDAAPTQHDPDATMMFSAGEVPGFGMPAAPAPQQGGAFDAERTMMFGGGGGGGFGAPQPPAPQQGGGFDADRTMLFGGAPAAPAAPPPPQQGGFDADRTMLFGQPAAAPPAPAPPAPSGGFDADRTMAFNPSLAPPPAAPWTPPAAPASGGADWLKPATPAVPDSDSTMMSPPTNDFGFAAPAAPSPFGPPATPASSGAGSKPLQDFALPAAPPAFTPPSGLGSGPALPPPPSGGGFSFELPPPPAKSGGGVMPDLPSVGFSSPPPTFTPAPPPPMPPPGTGKKPGGQFGEVDPGEIESLAVPTIAPTAPTSDDTSRKEREEQLKREYEQQYGRTTPSSSAPPPRPAASGKPAVSPKFLVGLLVVMAVVLGGGFLGIRWWQNRGSGQTGPTGPTVAKLTDEEIDAQMSAKLLDADKALRDGKLMDAEHIIQDVRNIALKYNRPVPQRVTLVGSELEREKQYQDAFQHAVKSFCVEDYPKANIAFLDLERQRPDKKEAGKYIERIFWNLGIEKLQQMEPWEAIYYFDNLVQRDPNDHEAKALLDYAKQFQPGANLGDDYLRRVDPLSTRMAGCR